MQLHATDITMLSLSGQAFYFYNVVGRRWVCVYACVYVRVGVYARAYTRGDDTVHNTITPLPLNYIIQINFPAR